MAKFSKIPIFCPIKNRNLGKKEWETIIVLPFSRLFVDKGIQIVLKTCFSLVIFSASVNTFLG